MKYNVLTNINIYLTTIYMPTGGYLQAVKAGF